MYVPYKTGDSGDTGVAEPGHTTITTITGLKRYMPLGVARERGGGGKPSKIPPFWVLRP